LISFIPSYQISTAHLLFCACFFQKRCVTKKSIPPERIDIKELPSARIKIHVGSPYVGVINSNIKGNNAIPMPTIQVNLSLKSLFTVL